MPDLAQRDRSPNYHFSTWPLLFYCCDRLSIFCLFFSPKSISKSIKGNLNNLVSFLRKSRKSERLRLAKSSAPFSDVAGETGKEMRALVPLSVSLRLVTVRSAPQL